MKMVAATDPINIRRFAGESTRQTETIPCIFTQPLNPPGCRNIRHERDFIYRLIIKRTLQICAGDAVKLRRIETGRAMSEAEEATPEVVEEKKKLPVKAIVFTAAGAIAMGAAAAGASFMLAPGAGKCTVESAKAGEKSGGHGDIKDVAFVNIEPLVVTLGENARSRYLKISISLETTKSHQKNLNDLTPRIRDTLNNYLRAVEEDDLVRPSSMTRLRAQMLRRLQLVAPSEVISDILITDFVLT